MGIRIRANMKFLKEWLTQVSTNDADIAVNTAAIAVNTAAIAGLPAAGPTTKSGTVVGGAGEASWAVTLATPFADTNYSVVCGYRDGFNVGGTAPTATGEFKVVNDSASQFTVTYVDNSGNSLGNMDGFSFDWIAVAHSNPSP